MPDALVRLADKTFVGCRDQAHATLEHRVLQGETVLANEHRTSSSCIEQDALLTTRRRDA